MTPIEIADTILDEASSPGELRQALEAFTRLCSEVGGIQPDPGFDAWADDSLLDDGVAINPQAAAHCVRDYQRSVVFIRGVYAAIKTTRVRFPDSATDILYAGCGPFATLLLPVLHRFTPGELAITLLDIHQRSLDSVQQLLAHFGLSAQACRCVQEDACRYQHPGRPHLIIAETMQKALEQEPQFAVTANLAPQLCDNGIFIPQNIEVEMYLAQPENGGKRYPLGRVCTLSPETAAEQVRKATYNAQSSTLELAPVTVNIPDIKPGEHFAAALFTRIQVFQQYCLGDYESEITLPLICHEMRHLVGGERYRVSYQLGSYPVFHCRRYNE